MDFAQHQLDPARHLVGVGGVILLHVLVIYALVTGLARKVVEVVKGPIEVKVIEEVIKKPPPPPEVIPPPPKMQAPPPPFVPPPEVNDRPAAAGAHHHCGDAGGTAGTASSRDRQGPGTYGTPGPHRRRQFAARRSCVPTIAK